jgi:hypothetical protein
MIFRFDCQCGEVQDRESRAFRPPDAPDCPACGAVMQRVYGANIDTSGCRDHDFIPPEKRVVRSANIMSGRECNSHKEERRFQKHIEHQRQLAAANSGGDFRKTHSIPADLYHGKIRETGDRHYWDDPSNRDRHRSTKVS